jgi:Cys-rich repeat protein
MSRVVLAALAGMIWVSGCGPQVAPGAGDAGACGAAGQACCEHAGCNAGLSCEGNVCEPPQQPTSDLGTACSKNLDCSSGICLPISSTQNVCTLSCSADGGCLAGWTCGTLPGQAGEICQCTPTAQTCDGKDDDCNGVIDDQPAANNWCVAQQGAGAVCSHGACVTGMSCTTSQDCLAGQICNPQTHLCTSETNGTDAGPSTDGGPPDSGFAGDAGPVDSGFAVDSGVPQDGGNVGPGQDAGQEDAGQPGRDAGVRSDAGFTACASSHPTAVLHVSQGNVAVDPTSQYLTPLSTITFDGSSSVPASGSITSYRWQLLSQPAGGIAQLAANGAIATLLPQFAGTYKVALVVKDDSGCVNGVAVTINVGLATGIVVQLSWPQTYGDLDLHYVGPGGSFYETTPYPGDLDFRYTQDNGYLTQLQSPGPGGSPDWGGKDGGVGTVAPDGISTDDGTFLMDQHWGYGAEIVMYPAPFNGTYTIMAHYYCAHDESSFSATTNYGPTTPVVSVWFNGTLIWSGQSGPLQEGQVWTAATVKVTNNGANAAVTPSSLPFTTAPAGDSCTASTPATSPGCTMNTDCATDPAGPVCDTAPGVGTCTQCVADSDCATGDMCQFNRCVTAPTDGGVISADAGTPTSDAGLPPGECNTDADCPAGQTCLNLGTGIGFCF